MPLSADMNDQRKFEQILMQFRREPFGIVTYDDIRDCFKAVAPDEIGGILTAGASESGLDEYIVRNLCPGIAAQLESNGWTVVRYLDPEH